MGRILDPSPRLRGRYWHSKRWRRGWSGGPQLRAAAALGSPGEITWPPLCLQSTADLGPVLHVLQQVAAAPVLIETPVAAGAQETWSAPTRAAMSQSTPAPAPSGPPAWQASPSPAPSLPAHPGQEAEEEEEDPDGLAGLVEIVDAADLDLPEGWL